MSTNKIIFFFFFFAFVFTSCKKDYPDDIPQWIKDEILECKRTHSCCGNGGPRLIKEYNWNDSVMVYYFGISDGRDAFYNIDGSQICYYINGLTNCPNDLKNFTNLKLIRKIWEQDMGKCNQKRSK